MYGEESHISGRVLLQLSFSTVLTPYAFSVIISTPNCKSLVECKDGSIDYALWLWHSPLSHWPLSLWRVRIHYPVTQDQCYIWVTTFHLSQVSPGILYRSYHLGRNNGWVCWLMPSQTGIQTRFMDLQPGILNDILTFSSVVSLTESRDKIIKVSIDEMFMLNICPRRSLLYRLHQVN